MAKRRIAVDANILIAALLGGRALRILDRFPAEFLTTETTIWEARKYLPLVSTKTGRPESELLRDLEELPVHTLPRLRYNHAMPTALSLIGRRDPKDAELLALVLVIPMPVWSNDGDFASIPGVTRMTTAELLTQLYGEES
jgi:predicted nucleic acid-binding protein